MDLGDEIAELMSDDETLSEFVAPQSKWNLTVEPLEAVEEGDAVASFTLTATCAADDFDEGDEIHGRLLDDRRTLVIDTFA